METVQTNLSWIVLFPLIGAVLSYLVGKVNKDLSGWIATSASALSFGCVISAFRTLGDRVFEDNLFLWFSTGDLSVDFTLRFDHLTSVMCLVVTGIGTLIHLYSVGYMHEDESRPRFFSYLNLFMFSMLLLITGANLLVMFVGWEGVGLCSYLLIGFWFKNSAYAAAGRKAFVVNRIGDLGFLLGIFLLYREFGTVDFVELSQAILGQTSVSSIPGFTMGAFCTLVAGCLFIGATGKSAQIPLFATPVSALIHAATMVTAGVYMIARLNILFAAAPLTAAVIVGLAVLTALIAAAVALTQNDIKKVLAYSTVSQLGFMFIAAGAGAYWVAVFHLVTHAFFKACLFLTAGSVIHGCHHEQDMRKMGGLRRYMPITTATYAISTLAIAGIFPFAGYQSKHAILGALAVSPNSYLIPYVNSLYLLASLTAFMTAFYMTRSFAMTFLGNYRGHGHPHESPLTMTVPLIVLALLSAVGGLVLGGAVGEGLSLQHYLSAVVPMGELHHHETVLESLLGSWVGFLGVGLAILLYTSLNQVPAIVYRAFLPLSKLSEGKFFFDEIYARILVRPLERAASFLWRFFDQSVVDGSVNGTAAVIDISGEVVRGLHTGQVRQYAFFMFLGTVLLILLCFVL
ncbi:MAG: NADH-quinone oxidoreductase subunit L [Proteobacteria bacterium]|nr:NADH-quinone oxidoreductase subunit L [Pseudomonadota bacterium]